MRKARDEAERKGRQMFGWLRKLAGQPATEAQPCASEPALPVTPAVAAPQPAPSAPPLPVVAPSVTTEVEAPLTPIIPTLTSQATTVEVAPEAPSDEPAATSAPAPKNTRDEQYRGLIPDPSARPAMPLSSHPNFAGLGLAPAPQQPPRMLEPEAALSPEAQRELLRLFDDLFGPQGRYRLEWRTARKPGDDSVFAEIMAADLVRRVQNTIADVAELERPEPLRAITARSECGEDELKRAS